jgi:hypothetical protein
VIDSLTQMLFASANVRPADTVSLIERLTHVRLQQQAELRRSLGLLREMVSPKAGSVSIHGVEVDGYQVPMELGGRRRKTC